MKTKKRDRKINKPVRPRYPHVVEETTEGRLVRYSRNVISWEPSSTPKYDVYSL